MDWVHLAHDSYKLRTVVNVVANLQKRKSYSFPCPRHEGMWGGGDIQLHSFLTSQ